MGKLLKFQKEENEECTCGYCEIIEEYKEYILDADTPEELHEIISDLVGEVKEKAYKEGYSGAIINDIDAKTHFLKHMDGEHCDECRDEICDC